MRTFLDWTYRAASALAALSLVALLGVLALQIAARALGLIVVWSDDIAGYLLVATSFLAMAGTFRQGGHVRVSLLLNRAGPRFRRILEAACLLLCVGLGAYLAYAAIDQAWDSFRFDERSTGIVPFRLWIPQAVMSAGIAIFLIAAVDALASVLRGDAPVYADRETIEGHAADESEPGAQEKNAGEEARRYAAAE